MEERRKEELHEEGVNYVEGEIGSRINLKDYCMQINTEAHPCTHDPPPAYRQILLVQPQLL